MSGVTVTTCAVVALWITYRAPAVAFGSATVQFAAPTQISISSDASAVQGLAQSVGIVLRATVRPAVVSAAVIVPPTLV